jgi:hypothetical protein
MCDKILRRTAISAKEEEFVRDMQTRFILRPGFVPSDKQINWFVSICRKYGTDKEMLAEWERHEKSGEQ